MQAVNIEYILKTPGVPGMINVGEIKPSVRDGGPDFAEGAGCDMNYRIIDGAENMDLEEVVRLLRMTYWADRRPVAQIEKSMQNSSCYGVFLDDEKKLVGFARVISDYATTYYLCDVIIDPAYRHRGLGTALVSCIESLPEYAGLRGILITRDAHTLYRKFGYEVLNERVMVKSLNC